MAQFKPTIVSRLIVEDIRFPTSLEQHGSDAVHTDPDYSCAYVTLLTNKPIKGEGLTFTIGRGTEIVVETIRSLAHHVIGKSMSTLFAPFSLTYRQLTSDPQLRWLGPEKGVLHLATAAIVNALWDLYAKIQGKPLWKCLVDMEPEELVSTIDFRYITDALTEEEAIRMLKAMQKHKEIKEQEVVQKGYPAYVTAAGWLGYSDNVIEKKCKKYLAEGWTHFKLKVGVNLSDDMRRCKTFRKIIGDENVMMVDANQRWSVTEAIDWMKNLAPYKPLWIEEPTSPDDVLGHEAISAALKGYGIGVATGEMCQNRVMFKQFLQRGAMNFCQIDCARMGGVPDVLAVYLMAKKFEVPVCPHAGGVGLCEMVQHLQIWDYISVSGSMENRCIEYVDHLFEHSKNPPQIENARYIVPKVPGYNAELLEASRKKYAYPKGEAWQSLFKEGKFVEPSET